MKTFSTLLIFGFLFITPTLNAQNVENQSSCDVIAKFIALETGTLDCNCSASICVPSGQSGSFPAQAAGCDPWGRIDILQSDICPDECTYAGCLKIGNDCLNGCSTSYYNGSTGCTSSPCVGTSSGFIDGGGNANITD